MSSKGRRVTPSSHNTSCKAANEESNKKSRTSKSKQKIPNRQINNSYRLHNTEVKKSAPSNSARVLRKGGKKLASGSEVTGLPDADSQNNFVLSSQKSLLKSKLGQQTNFTSQRHEKGQPSLSKKRRFDSSDSSSIELQNITLRSDSGFETESNRSTTSPVFDETVSKSATKDIFGIEFADKPLSPACSQMWPNLSDKSLSICHYFCNRSLGKLSSANSKARIDQHVLSPVAEFEIFDHDKPFGSRITTIDWHPRKGNFFCASSKHGDLGFYQVNSDNNKKLQAVKTYSGIGPGGYISAFKFHPVDNERFYTSTLEGKVVLGNTNWSGNHVEKVLLETGTWDFWYCAMDVSPVEDFVVAGRNNGMTVMCTTSGEPIWQLRLHSKKVTHAELSPREPHILCTASLDHSVRVWDLRMLREIKGRPLPLNELHHKKGVNSAYFSQTDGSRLLTTDQHDEIRVYRAPFWHLETTIVHPHRFFRHLTPHKAAWHPLTDKIVIGRYPGDSSHPEFGLERTIDIFDAATGKIHFELKDTRYNGLVSLCKFNNTGNMLLSTMGYQINVWGKEPEDTMKEESSKQTVYQRKDSELALTKPKLSRARKLAKIKLSKMND